MFQGEYADSGFAELDDVSAAAYGLAVECGRFDRERIAEQLSLTHDEIARVESVLSGVRLLQSVPGHSHQLTPVTPDAAAASLVGPAERQIRDLQQAITDVRAKLMSLTPSTSRDAGCAITWKPSTSSVTPPGSRRCSTTWARPARAS